MYVSMLKYVIQTKYNMKIRFHLIRLCRVVSKHSTYYSPSVCKINKIALCCLYTYSTTSCFQENESQFSESDVSIFEAFAIFCGLGIHNTQMYENACKLMAKQKVN